MLKMRAHCIHLKKVTLPTLKFTAKIVHWSMVRQKTWVFLRVILVDINHPQILHWKNTSRRFIAMHNILILQSGSDWSKLSRYQYIYPRCGFLYDGDMTTCGYFIIALVTHKCYGIYMNRHNMFPQIIAIFTFIFT